VLIREAIKVPGVTFTAVCDIVPPRIDQAQKVLTDNGKPKAKEYTDYHKLLEDKDIGAVVIAAPLHMHAPLTIEAFKTGHDVFCEKTMAYSIEQCKDMIKAQGKHVLQIGHHLRYHPVYHIAKSRFIDGQGGQPGLLGKIFNVHAQWSRNSAWRKEPETGVKVDMKQWKYENDDELWNWRLYRKFSGGVMTELASHQLDVINWYLGDKPPLAIQGVGRIDWKDGRTIFDNVHLIYEFPDEVQLSYEGITKNAYNPFGWEVYEMIQGEKGTLILAHLGPGDPKAGYKMGFFFLEPPNTEPLWAAMAPHANFDNGQVKREYQKALVVGKPAGDGDIAGIKVAEMFSPTGELTMSTYELEFYDFKRAVLDRKTPFCDGLVGLKSAIPALLGYQAMEEKKRIEVPKDIAVIG
jgi:predicted dehydrogenase